MGIPIRNYIGITSKMSRTASAENISFGGLVFSSASMKSSVPADYTTIKTDYESGKAVELSADDIFEVFDASSPVAKFASKVVGYSNLQQTVAVAKVLTGDSTPSAAFNRVTQEYMNFGSFTFVGVYDDDEPEFSYSDLAALATSTAGLGYAMIVAIQKSEQSTIAPSFANNEHVFLVQGNLETDDVNYAAWMPMAWYGAVDYTSANASDTIDYRSFAGAIATVDDQAGKTAADALNVNYIGKVQTRGLERSFMQCGVTMSGLDLGEYRDKTWIENQINQGWFNLNDGRKVEASESGASKVRLMVVGVANRGIDNGSILINKPLTDAQLADILSFTNDESASGEVQRTGYYINASIVPEGNKYACRYTLVYAKGGHVSKVSGLHVLV